MPKLTGSGAARGRDPPPPDRAPDPDGGFVLLETLVAFLILAVTLTAAIAAISQGSSSVRRAGAAKLAADVAREIAAVYLAPSRRRWSRRASCVAPLHGSSPALDEDGPGPLRRDDQRAPRRRGATLRLSQLRRRPPAQGHAVRSVAGTGVRAAWCWSSFSPGSRPRDHIGADGRNVGADADRRSSHHPENGPAELAAAADHRTISAARPVALPGTEPRRPPVLLGTVDGLRFVAITRRGVDTLDLSDVTLVGTLRASHCPDAPAVEAVIIVEDLAAASSPLSTPTAESCRVGLPRPCPQAYE